MDFIKNEYFIYGIIIFNFILLILLIQKVGVVRYNAFENTGSDLSFALALLDNKDNGIVLNGIFSRESSNLYAKPVISGKSSYSISEEEEKAIEKAIQGKI